MRRVILLSFAVLAAACRPAPEPAEPSRTPDRPSVEVALVAATPGPSESEATRAMQGARLAFDLANEEEVLPVDLIATAYATSEEPAEADRMAAEIQADDSTVAAVVWPGGPDSPAVRDLGGLGVVDLSPVEPPGSGSWVRLVATDAAQAEALAGLVETNKACVAGDTGLRGTWLADRVAGELRDRGVKVPVRETVEAGQDSYASLVQRLEEAGCSTLVWTGGAVEAASIVQESGGELQLLGTDRLLNDGFIEAAGDLAEHSVATCPCGDVAVSADLEVQRFVQEYQSRYGTAPSAYAAEGWDAAQLIIDTIADVGTDRAAVAEALTPPLESMGLLRDYRVGADGESSPPVTVQEIRGGTWVPSEAKG
jgi:branched-chain amino acid transport system substrate-binding protein